MKNHSILFTAPCVAEYLETDMPVAGAGEVLVEIARTAISSGTERANLIGDANTNSTKPGEVKFPRICGYSAAGVVKDLHPCTADEFAQRTGVLAGCAAHIQPAAGIAAVIHHDPAIGQNRKGTGLSVKSRDL